MMATRQELLTAVNLVRNVCRMNNAITHLVFAIEANENDFPVSPEIGKSSFEIQKDCARSICNVISEKSERINIFLEKCDSIYLARGISGLKLTYTNDDISSDSQNLKAASTNLKPLIENAKNRPELNEVDISSIKAYHSQCGTIQPDTSKLIPIELQHANILHDILDAMSYELQGRDSYTGKLHGMNLVQLRGLIKNRLFTGWIYHRRLTNNSEVIGSPDKAEMGGVLLYVEERYNTLTDLSLLGQYIDAEIPKQIILRRWWAL